MDEVELVSWEFVSCLKKQHSPFQGAPDGMVAVRRLLPRLKSGPNPAKVHVRNWMRTRVVNRAMPLPVELVQAMVSAPCISGRANLRGFLPVSFVALLRTSEAVGLKVSQDRCLHNANTIIPCVTSFQHCAALWSGKTGAGGRPKRCGPA